MPLQMVKPALWKAPHGEVPWTWVRLPELAAIIGATSEEVFERYEALSKHGVVVKVTDGHRVHDYIWYLPELDQEGWYISAGWANDILDAYAQGIFSVTRIEVSKHNVTDPFGWHLPPEGTIGWYPPNGIAAYALVGLKKDGQPIWTYATCEHTAGKRIFQVHRTCEEAGCTGESHMCGTFVLTVCSRCGAIVNEEWVP